MNNKEKSRQLRFEYRYWKQQSLEKSGYFIIFQGFLENNILKDISGNALKLYIYLGVNSNNMEGIVWHSNKTIANYFNKSERTIRLWMKELEDKNLIQRMRLQFDGQVYTYLKPYYDQKGNLKKLLPGYLIFDNNNNLCFKNLNQTYLLNNNEYECAIFFKDRGPVLGHLQFNSSSKEYIFNSFENDIQLHLNYVRYKFTTIKVLLKLE